jgi:heat-inducible transcriptional repressor
VIKTEVLPTERKLSAFMVKRLESYFHWRLTGNDKPAHMEPHEEQLAQKYYNEMIVRYIVGYSNFTEEEVLRTGFSKLLTYPEFQNPGSLASSLALFENAHTVRLLLKECSKLNQIKFWMGDDLANYCNGAPSCAVVAAPYAIGQQTVGAVGLMGPLRMPYRELFSLLRTFSENISFALTRSIYKFKITFRQPHLGAASLKTQSQLMLLEDKRSLHT